jgi:hypothetical protein
VQSRSPWLHFPAISGETEAQVIVRNNNEVLLPLVLSASGLRERATPYQETLSINVQSSYVAAARTQQLEVSLTVQVSPVCEPVCQSVCQPQPWLCNDRLGLLVAYNGPALHHMPLTGTGSLKCTLVTHPCTHSRTHPHARTHVHIFAART